MLKLTFGDETGEVREYPISEVRITGVGVILQDPALPGNTQCITFDKLERIEYAHNVTPTDIKKAQYFLKIHSDKNQKSSGITTT